MKKILFFLVIFMTAVSSVSARTNLDLSNSSATVLPTVLPGDLVLKSAGWFYLHFSGDEGYWEITVKTMDGERFTASFYCSGCTGLSGGLPGWGDDYDNNY